MDMTMEKLRILDECRLIMMIIFKVCADHHSFNYTMNQQIIKSGLSIGSNIAEGNERVGLDRNHHFNIALGSLEECRFQFSCYKHPDDEGLDPYDFNEILDKIKGTVKKLKSLSPSSSLFGNPS